MEITVHRQACCSADDQMGPLEAKYRIETQTTLSTLIKEIITSNFLQFSSSHDHLTGEVEGRKFVEIYSTNGFYTPYGSYCKMPEFIVDPDENAMKILGGKFLSFHFRNI
jgi:hypothetical protein